MLDAVKAELTELSARGLANAFSRAVRSGAIAPGQKVPAIRTVARELGFSPTTVSSAWRMLARANIIHSEGAKGTTVADIGGPARHRRALQYEARFETDLSTGLPDPGLLPDIGPALRRIPYGGPLESFLAEPILPDLRTLLLDDWPMPADAITIVDGATDALDLVTSKVLQFGDRVAVEHPAYPPLLDLLEAVGARTVALDLDDDGPTPGSVSAAVEAGVRAVFLQCRAQNPTGASVTAERAEELAAIIRGREVVVELDLGAAIASTPLTSLGAHLPDRTIHIRAYSESHGPDLRLAAIGGSSVQMDQLIRRRHLGQGWTSRLLQHLLLDLLTHEESRRQVAAAREEYARRREALVGALAGHGIEVGGKDGITLWVPVENQAAALMMLSSHGLGVAPGGPYLVRADGEPHVAVTVGLLPAEKAPGVAAVLAQAARPSARSAIH